MKYLLFYLYVVNVLVFALHGIDKYKAMKSKRRISEKALHTWMFLGGSIGAFIGQKMFHHKTAKEGFQFVFWVLFVVQLSIVIFVAVFIKNL